VQTEGNQSKMLYDESLCLVTKIDCGRKRVAIRKKGLRRGRISEVDYTLKQAWLSERNEPLRTPKPEPIYEGRGEGETY